MITARLTFTGKGTREIGLSLQPDNLPNMDMSIDGTALSFRFATEKPGTLLATIDDLLTNVKVAEETLVSTGG